MAKIQKNDRVPIYYQLMDIIIEEIKDGKYKENDQLPSERDLCTIYDISRATVRQTILELEREGYIYKVHGKGTFVSPKRFKQDLLKFYSFTEEMKKIGKSPSSKVLNFDIVMASEKIAKKMNIDSGKAVYMFTRLRLADEQPMILETSYVPCDRFPGITKEQLQNNPMYDILTKEYNAEFTKAEEGFQPVTVREDEAIYLQCQPNIPCMMIERTTYEGDRIIEYTMGIARGDRFKYCVVLTK